MKLGKRLPFGRSAQGCGPAQDSLRQEASFRLPGPLLSELALALWGWSGLCEAQTAPGSALRGAMQVWPRENNKASGAHRAWAGPVVRAVDAGGDRAQLSWGVCWQRRQGGVNMRLACSQWSLWV